MKFLLVFILKILYSIWYFFPILFQFLWKFNYKDIDWSVPSFNMDKSNYDGWYHANLFDFWRDKYSFSEEYGQQYTENHSSSDY